MISELKIAKMGTALTLATLAMTCANAVPIVIAQMEGYNFGSQGRDAGGINILNSTIRNALAGQNYFSRVFEWDQIAQTQNYFNLFPEANYYLVGFSRGGYQALRTAEQMRLSGQSISAMTLIDPVRCGGTGNYASDSVFGCITNQLISSGPQIVPTNVSRATSYFQTGTSSTNIIGERNVTGASNINFNTLVNDPSILHTTIDDDPRLHRRIIDDIRPLLDNSRLMSGLGGAQGFGTLAMTPNDDGSTSAISLPFSINLNGSTFNSFHINNNGNITFGGSYGSYTPEGFNGLSVQMLAPYWADVDTRCGNCGGVYFSAPTADTAVITWNRVGYFAEHSDKVNTFQLIIRNRDDLAGSNTDVEFRYSNLQWTTGDASGGESGFGGVPAYAGYTGATGNPAQTLSGSGTSDVISLESRSNIGQPGRWQFSFRDGVSPGLTPDNPLLPDVIDGNWRFQFQTTSVDQIVWSDPVVVYGYDFTASGATRFSGFVLPVLGDNEYQLWLEMDGTLTLVGTVLGGSQYNFSDLGYSDGLTFFRVTGVDSTLGIDPSNTSAFVTGLRFTQAGLVQWGQSSLAVPEMETKLYFFVGLALLFHLALRRRARI